MADITFNCPKCNNALVVDESGSGRLVNCPHCKNQIKIPTLADAMDIPSAVPPLPISSASSQEKACPFCGENILLVATKCKHCGSMLTSSQSEQKAPTKPAGFVDAVKQDGKKLMDCLRKGENIHGRKIFAWNPKGSDAGPVQCPKCQSTSVQGVTKGFGAGKGCLGWMLVGPIGLLCGACGKNKMYSVCLRCGHKWKL